VVDEWAEVAGVARVYGVAAVAAVEDARPLDKVRGQVRGQHLGPP
jgi:hypothetical protein